LKAGIMSELKAPTPRGAIYFGRLLVGYGRAVGQIWARRHSRAVPLRAVIWLVRLPLGMG